LLPYLLCLLLLLVPWLLCKGPMAMLLLLCWPGLRLVTAVLLPAGLLLLLMALV
jgi:hypothetical protein